MSKRFGSINGLKLKLILYIVIVVVIFVCGLMLFNKKIHVRYPNMATTGVAWNVSKDWEGNRDLHEVPSSTKQNTTESKGTSLKGMHIAVVICQNRREEGLVMLKSAFIFSKTYLVFHIFTEDSHRQAIVDEINSWPESQRDRLKVNIYDIQFPTSVTSCQTCKKDDWATLFRPCAAQRLFMHEILKDIDALIYMDTDSLFLSPVEDVWAHFTKFTPYQIAGLTPELSGWYADKTFPYCTETGLNSGVMLMNLTRIRHVHWFVKLKEYYTAYRQHLRLGDQDLLNIYFHFHPGQVYLMTCSWNYRGIFCPADKQCNETESLGAFILHGNSQVFHNDIFPTIREVYRAFKEHNMTNQTLRDLYNSMLTNMKPHATTECGKRPHLFTKHVEKYVLANEKENGWSSKGAYSY